MDKVILNRFSLEIIASGMPVEKIIRKGGNYFAMPHETEYKIRLRNDHDINVDAHVWVDGKKAGVWRINPLSEIEIERPSDVARKFVLLKEGSKEALVAGIDSGHNDNGLIRVTFKPEKVPEYLRNLETVSYFNTSNSNSIPRTCGVNNQAYSDTVTPQNKYYRSNQCMNDYYRLANSFQSGATALGDDSYQRFRRVSSLHEIDKKNITTIFVRLVVDNDKSTYKRSYIGFRQGYNNKKPGRIELQHPSRSNECWVDSGYKLSKKYWFDNF